jgi:hypothetical protein
MGISSTLSALLVANEGDNTFVQAVWYPYFAGYDTLLGMGLLGSDFISCRPSVQPGIT